MKRSIDSSSTNQLCKLPKTGQPPSSTTSTSSSIMTNEERTVASPTRTTNGDTIEARLPIKWRDICYFQANPRDYSTFTCERCKQRLLPEGGGRMRCSMKDWLWLCHKCLEIYKHQVSIPAKCVNQQICNYERQIGIQLN